MKRFLFILGIVILVVLVFTWGLVAGTMLNYFQLMTETSFFENEAISTANTFTVVQMLDKNEIDEAKASLSLTLDNQIMTVAMLMSACDNEKSKRMANGILARIARHREKYPVHSIVEGADEVIQEYLEKALQEVEKRQKTEPTYPSDSE
jgi:hypothetical protein